MNLVPIRTPLATVPLVPIERRAADEAYFGKTDSPYRQTLIAALGVELGAPDPTTSGHTTVHPSTGETPIRARRLDDLLRHGQQFRLESPRCPFFSLSFDTWASLERSEVNRPHLSHVGLSGFKSAWIDTNRRAS
jgi:hypothetical protein